MESICYKRSSRLLTKEIFEEPKPLLLEPRINLTWSIGGGGGAGWGDWERQGGGWSELWKYRGGVLCQRFSMRH